MYPKELFRVLIIQSSATITQSQVYHQTSLQSSRYKYRLQAATEKNQMTTLVISLQIKLPSKSTFHLNSSLKKRPFKSTARIQSRRECGRLVLFLHYQLFSCYYARTPLRRRCAGADAFPQFLRSVGVLAMPTTPSSGGDDDDELYRRTWEIREMDVT